MFLEEGLGHFVFFFWGGSLCVRGTPTLPFKLGNNYVEAQLWTFGLGSEWVRV